MKPAHPRSSRVILGATTLLLAACGARSTLLADGGEHGGAATTGGAGGTAGNGGAVADAGPDAPPPCTTWTVATPDPIALTEPIGDALLSGVAVDGDRVFIGSVNDNDPSPDPTWRVRVVSGDLASIGPSQVVMTHAKSVSLSGMQIAAGAGHRAGVAWDEDNGCRFVTLADDGAAAAPPVVIDGGWCYWPYATAQGFTTFVSQAFLFAPLSLLTLDPAGNVIGKKNDVVPKQTTSTSPYFRARLDDGSIVLAWTQGPSGAPVIELQHFSATGDALGKPKDLLPLGAETQLALVSLGSSLLAAWSVDASPGEVHAQPLDVDGNATGPESVLAAADGTTVGTIAMATVSGGVLVAWTKGEAGAYQALTVQAVTTAGAPVGAPLPVPTPSFLGKVVLLPTPAGVVAAFDAEKPQSPTQVFVTRLVCGG